MNPTILAYLIFLTGLYLYLADIQSFGLLLIYLGCITFIFINFNKGDLPKWSSWSLNTKKEDLNIFYESILSFWKEDFKKSYRNEKVYHLAWEIPVLLTISFYNFISSRLRLVTLLFFFRCWSGILIFGDPYSFILLFLYIIPLVFVTSLARLDFFTNHLKKVYGEITLKKLGFNGPFRYLHLNGKQIIIIGASAATTYVGGGILNDYTSYYVNEIEVERQVKAYTRDIHSYTEAGNQNPNFTGKYRNFQI